MARKTQPKGRKATRTKPVALPSVNRAGGKHARPEDNAPFTIVGVGASAGGLEAFTELLRHLPLDTGMAFVLVQHLDPQHESALTQLLARATRLPVREVTQNLRVKPNQVYVIPPNASLSIARGVLKLEPRAGGRMPHRPIDSFFDALAEDRREHAIGVVLSGTASDGTAGLETIKAEGGITFAQDESAKYDSMPRSAVAAGCVDFVMSPKDIAAELARIARHPSMVGGRPEHDRAVATAHEDDASPLPSGGSGAPDTSARRAQREARQGTGGADVGGYKKILLLLRNHCGVDFALYKSSTIQRRVTRRMVLNKQETLAGYADFLRGNGKELDALYSDVLISVTSFFRNPEAFETLRREVFPRLLQKRSEEPLRVWVLGCSTGQEAYSLVITYMEAAEAAPRARKLQVFATDLNDALLTKARHGLYAASLAQDLSPERLRRFFTQEEGGYRVIKPVREMVVFARQNMLSDPPFSRMDLISCRNLMIYFEPDLQRKVMPTLHYALKPDGYLFLGQSESVGSFTELFEPLDKKQKIFARKAAPGGGVPLPLRKQERELPAPRARSSSSSAARATGESDHAELSAQREADRVTLSRYAPASVLINSDLQVLQFRGATSAYLQPPAGRASFDLLKMAREGLLLPLRAALAQARKEGKSVRRENLPVRGNRGNRLVSLEVVPLRNLRERHFLVMFEDASSAARAVEAAAPAPIPAFPRKRGKGKEDRDAARLAELGSELAETRDYLQSVQEQHAAAVEELQASNEEVQSGNEELQSVNEELETSKEELESANEELTTVNEEMANRNVELGQLNSDLLNFQNSARLSVLLLNRGLAVRRFSTQAEKQFDLRVTDIGRPLGQIRHHLRVDDLEALTAEVITSVRETERDVRDDAGRWFSLRIRPYLTSDNKVDGAVLVLVDISDRKRSEQTAIALREFSESIVESVPDPLLILNADLRVHSANPAFYRAFKVRREDSVARLVYDLCNRQWNIPRLRELLEQILPAKSSFDEFEVTHEFPGIGSRVMLLNARQLTTEEGPARILLGMRDVTESRRLEQTFKDADRSKNEFLAMLAHELRNPLAALRNATEILRHPAAEASMLESAKSTLDKQTRNMIEMVNDLLDVSRITRGTVQLHKQPVRLQQVMQQAADGCAYGMKARRQELTHLLHEEPIWVLGDPTRLEQVFSNLLGNASKFTPDGGAIRMSVRRERHDGAGERAVISVRDSGIGMPPELLPNVFDLFVQGDHSTQRLGGGLGIGLTLARKVVELHGGTLVAHSEGVGKGSELIVRLPVVEAPAVEEPEIAAGTQMRPAVRRVLLVDDNRDGARMMTALLKLQGHTVKAAHDGLSGLELARKFRPDVILLDIGMPGLDGYAVAERLRADATTREALLIAVTGYGSDEDARHARAAGFDYHLTKPVDAEEIVGLVAQGRPKRTGTH